MKRMILALAVVLGTAAFAAAAPQFPKYPAQAVKYLKGEQGKPVKTGMVFVNGHFIPPPYSVARVGTVIKINGAQVTGQVVAWNSFLSTQPESVVDKRTVVPGEGGGAAPAGDGAKKTGEADDLFDDFSGIAPSFPIDIAMPGTDALDDLFGDDDDEDEPAPKKQTSPARKPAAAPKPKPAKPAPVYTLKGEFEMNSAAQQMLAKVKAVRTEIDKTLREGGMCFFSPLHPRKVFGARMANEFIGVAPEILRDASSAAQIEAKLKAKNIYYIEPVMCRLLYANRADYLALQNYRSELQKASQMRNILNGKR